MPCTPISDNQVIPGPSAPFAGSGGFAVQSQNFNIPFPPEIFPALSDLYNAIQVIVPPGILLKPVLHPDVINEAYGAINSILSQIAPFLTLYKFFLPVLNLIICIIDVLCAIPNPFKLISAMIKLFRTCIPEFLALFPFFALVLIIITLLLMIITLIEYLIQRIITIIEVIVSNIALLYKAATRADQDSISSVLHKIGSLLCLFQDLFIILDVVAAIIEIIKAMLGLSFSIPPCSDSDSSSSGCCTPDVCPSFIKNNSTITGTTGNFLYYNEVGISSGLDLPVGFPPIVNILRNESWQFYDPNLVQDQAFINITKAFDLPAGNNTVFFPNGSTYTTSSSPSSAPYTINFRFFYNPATFGRTDPLGARYLNIINAIVQSPPTAGVISYNGTTLIAPFDGTLNLVGGVIQEDNGTQILDANGNPIPLNTFIHNAVRIGTPSPTDGILFPNLTYTFTINHEVLLGASLITLGCVPELASAKNFINATIGAQFNTNGVNLANVIPLLPDIAATQTCISNAVSAYTTSISQASTAVFQSTVMTCLNDLNNQTIIAVGATISAGFDQYNSNFTVLPAIQFTTLPIIVSISLNESSGQSMTNNLPQSAADQLAAQLSAVVSLGSITNFSYDGYSLFTANITSDIEGNGTVKVAFNNNYISTLNNPTDLSQTPTVAITEIPYTFVKSSSFVSSQRRDEGDVARDGS